MEVLMKDKKLKYAVLLIICILIQCLCLYLIYAHDHDWIVFASSCGIVISMLIQKKYLINEFRMRRKMITTKDDILLNHEIYAAAKAYRFMSTLFASFLLIYAISGLLTKVIFFTFVIIYFLCEIYRICLIKRNE